MKHKRYIYIYINDNYITIRMVKRIQKKKKYLFLYQICIIAKYYLVFCNRDGSYKDDERMPVSECNRALRFLRR